MRQCIRMAGTSRRPNVTTLGQLLCRSTSGNVATSQRRDVSTSRRCNVAKPVRVLFSHHLKANRMRILGYRETYRLGGGNQSSNDIDLEEEPEICIVSSF